MNGNTSKCHPVYITQSCSLHPLRTPFLTSEEAAIHEETSSYFNRYKMRLRSNRIHQCLTTGTWWHSWPCLRPHKHSLQLCCFPGKNSMDEKRKRANTFQTCLRFRRMDRARMEQKRSDGARVENTGGRLEELALRWFTETQAPLILHEGNFPAWFQGFITRKDAEAKLTDKPLGCFLIRLSDKTIGYILSYRGRDRCRHFVINQNKAGQFIVSGDIETHKNLTDLIQHYRASPIEPFGEFLTSSYSESSSSEIYDVIQGKLRERLVSVEAVRSLWQQRTDHSQGHPPTLPPKNYNRRPNSPVSLDMDDPPQAAPPLPRRAPFQSNHLGGSLDETSTWRSPVLYAQLQKQRADQREQPPPTTENAGLDGPRSLPVAGPIAQTHRPRDGASLAPDIVYSELSLGNCRSRSLPLLDSDSGEVHSFRLSAPSFTPPQVSPNTSKKGGVQACSPSDQRLLFRPSAGSSDSLDNPCDNPLYQLAGMPRDAREGQRKPQGRAQSRPPISTPPQDEGTYAEVPCEPLPCPLLSDNAYEFIPDKDFNSSPFHDNTYELIPEQGIKKDARPVSADHSRLYESIKDQQPKHADAYWSSKNDKRRRFFPEHKKK
ncbi:SH2 domain-containing protein 7 [Anguilla rostrata]|uniref:SH2 domain-containing protein 7 n=1 Tax=Anguilla rostrata TaxID=7938 RepID=UPI0030D4E09E